MEVSEARRANFKDLLEAHGTIEALAEATASNPQHLSQIKNKSREMGRAVARRFEAKLGKPHGWMDTRDHTPAQGSLEVAAVIADLRKLPPLWQEHVAGKVADLLKLWESIPEPMRPLLVDPPKDPESYRVWEMNIRGLAAAPGAPERSTRPTGASSGHSSPHRKQ